MLGESKPCRSDVSPAPCLSLVTHDERVCWWHDDGVDLNP